jgi:hypothetical protein
MSSGSPSHLGYAGKSPRMNHLKDYTGSLVFENFKGNTTDLNLVRESGNSNLQGTNMIESTNLNENTSYLDHTDNKLALVKTK